ncbi:MAG: DUF4270 family protein [Flavobacteriaceae bacterium]|nr:DUF4270 family protein [Flavobacteriaceae bacterium]
MKNISFVWYALVLGLLINACNDPTPLGAELLEGDQVDVFFTDTVQLIVSTVNEDSVLTYDPDPSIVFDQFMFGNYTDPIFGKATASIYGQVVLDFDSPDFEDAVLDSLILTLRYDSAATYGVLDQDPFGIGVFRITGDTDIEEEYYSSSSIEVDEVNMIGEVSNFTPALFSVDSIKGLIDYHTNPNGDTIDIPASIRIPLSNDLGMELMEYDESIYEATSSFVESFKGVYLKPLTETPGLLSFDISSTSTSGITLYYTVDDTIHQQYQYDFSSRYIQFNKFEHDFGSALVNDFFEDKALGDSLLFIQALSGPVAKLEIPNLEQFDKTIVNKAELTFTVAVLAEDDPDNFPPGNNLLAVELDEEDNRFLALTDALIGGGNFGGRLTEETGPDGELIQTYTMNISNYFQDILDETKEPVIYLRAFPKQEQGARVVIYGPGHSKYPMKLTLAYTQLD